MLLVEVEVHAGPHDVVGHVRVDPQRGEGTDAGEAVIDVAVVHVEIFDFRAPLLGKHPLRANAGRPSGAVVLTLEDVAAVVVTPATVVVALIAAVLLI
jgi:hypothetical protein